MWCIGKNDTQRESERGTYAASILVQYHCVKLRTGEISVIYCKRCKRTNNQILTRRCVFCFSMFPEHTLLLRCFSVFFFFFFHFLSSCTSSRKHDEPDGRRSRESRDRSLPVVSIEDVVEGKKERRKRRRKRKGNEPEKHITKL